MTTVTDTAVLEVARAKPAEFLRDLRSIAGRALRAVPRDVEVVAGEHLFQPDRGEVQLLDVDRDADRGELGTDHLGRVHGVREVGYTKP